MVSLIGGMTGLSAKLIKPVMTNCGIGIPWRREDQENRLLKSLYLCPTFRLTLLILEGGGHFVLKGSKWTGNSDFFQNQTE